MMALKSKGVKNIIVVDIMAKRLEKALELGATHTIDASKTDSVEEIKLITKGRGVDLAIETAGTTVTTNQCIHATAKGATVVLVGYSSTGKMDLEMSLALDKELTFETVFRYKHIYPMAIEAVSKNDLMLEKLVTDIFDFDDVPNALEKAFVTKEILLNQ